jgi:hypothetical protein
MPTGCKCGENKTADVGTLWYVEGRNAYSADASDLQHSGERGKKCPGCNGPMPPVRLNFLPRSQGGENITHWIGRCLNCKANITIWND